MKSVSRILVVLALAYTASTSLAGLPASRITVPDDYPTIQAAVDAAAAGTTIKVRAGLYTEAVVVKTAGLEIMTTGGVTLNGGFYLTDDADDVTIRKFDIFPQGAPLPPSWPYGGNEFAGVYAFGVTGGEALDNTVVGSSGSYEIGIYYEESTGVTIKENTVSATNVGMAVRASSGFSIAGNTVTGAGPGLLLENNADGNTITGNAFTGNTHGIQVGGSFASCDDNLIKGNTCSSNGSFGILVLFATNTTIGSDNVANSNGVAGIFLGAATSGNTVTRNSVTGNGSCDIVNTGSSNTFSRNTAGCTSGF